MANIYDGGSVMFDALAYGKPHPSTMQFLANQFENMTSAMQNAGQQFFESARNMYEQFSGSHAMRVVRAAGRAVRAAWQLDEIRALQDIGEFQHAPLAMQRWIMAEPTTRQLYQQQRIDGYSETYFDHDPGTLGHDHYDYRRVMNGILVVDESDENPDNHGWTATTYFDELLPDEDELSHPEQLDILHAWDHLRAKIAAKGEDPTSRYNAEMG